MNVREGFMTVDYSRRGLRAAFVGPVAAGFAVAGFAFAGLAAALSRARILAGNLHVHFAAFLQAIHAHRDNGVARREARADFRYIPSVVPTVIGLTVTL